VVRITGIERAGDVTRVLWDPRRPLPSAFATPEGGGNAPVALIYGNVVPAHHGVPLWQLDDQTADTDPVFGRWRQLLTFTVEGAPGVEVPLPLAPLSVQATGYPLPGAPARSGTPAMRISVDRDEWQIVDDLSLAGPGDQVVTLRPADDGGTVLRFGDDVNGTSLPPRPVRIDLDMRVGMGAVGNVGVDQLTRIVQLGGAVGPSPTPDALGLSATNPLPAVEGRDPEPIDHLRYRAPLGVMDVLSGVTPGDCERLLGALPEVRAARAEVIEGGLRPLIRMTVLLRDDDLLSDDERLRRFADVRRTLEDVRLLGFDVEAVPPTWVPLDLDALVDADPHQSAGALRDSVIEAVAGVGGMLDPDVIGLGRDVELSTLYRAILAVPGVTGAVVDRFRRREPGAVDRLPDGTIPIRPHEVPVIRAPERSGMDGLFTVTVRGGLG
jgi:predicted phage baseplate assembly protein